MKLRSIEIGVEACFSETSIEAKNDDYWENEGVISYKGKPKYVVIAYEKYDKLWS